MRRAPVTISCWLAFAALSLNVGWARTPTSSSDEVVRIRAVADAWLGERGPGERGPGERGDAGGQAGAGKEHGKTGTLKGAEALVLLRFDLSDLIGREVLGASLLLHREGPDKLRYLRISTVNQDWGKRVALPGPSDEVTFQWAEARAWEPRPWAWPGSTVADVIMTAGNSLGCWAERMELESGWIAMEVSPQVIYSLALEDSDGLAVMEGGNPGLHRNVISSVWSRGCEPHLEIRLGGRLKATPAQPLLTAEPAPERASLASGAVKVTIDAVQDAFCWRVRLDGQTVERWRIKHPAPQGPTAFYLEDLPPAKQVTLEVMAVAPSGKTSAPAKLVVKTSPATGPGPVLRPLDKPPQARAAAREDGPLRVWALPGLVKVSPVTAKLLDDESGNPATDLPPEPQANPVWDGKQIRLFGARGEYVSYQLCLENGGDERLRSIRVRPQPLVGAGDEKIGLENIELLQSWYAKNSGGTWQPTCCTPITAATLLSIPRYPERLSEQQNQTVHVDLYIPKQAKPGRYAGMVLVTAAPELEIEIPVELEVLGFALPDRLTFWPELNGNRVPPSADGYYRLAHQHRCVLNCFAWQPKLIVTGNAVRVDWEEYDRLAGPLLNGEAFLENRRAGVPVECMYLPFDSNWPMPLSRECYSYKGHWPRKGESEDFLVQHCLTGPYIGNGLSDDYKRAFVSVQRQFVKHFAEKGYNQTEMQCFIGGKAQHRVQQGVNRWWTTEEPEHWDDWLALQFYLHLWTAGRRDADPRTWMARADISRPQWQGRTLNGVADCVYYGSGGFSGEAMVRRCRYLGQETAVNVRAYGSAGSEAANPLDNVAALVSAWADGADSYMVRQSLGSEKSLDRVDAGTEGGTALLVPGESLGAPAVADIRLKSLRDGQQFIEYLALLAERRHLSRGQIKLMLYAALHPSPEGRPAVSDPDSLQIGPLQPWQVAQLRRRVADLIK